MIIDETRCRKGGKGVCLAAMHHDPLRSTAHPPFFSFGHVWVVLAPWVPLPLGTARGLTLPILFRLDWSTKRGGQADTRSWRTRASARRRRREAVPKAHAPRNRSWPAT